MYERRPEQPGVLSHRRLPPARHQDDLDARPQARLERPRPEQRDAALPVVQQRPLPPEQRPVEIEVEAPEHSAYYAKGCPDDALPRLTDDGAADWDDLLADDRVVHASTEHGRLADHRRPSRRPAPRRPRSPRPRRHRRPLLTSGAGPRRRRRRSRDRHDRDRIRQVALLPPPDARHPLPRPQGPRPLPLSDEGPRPGPGPRDQRLRADRPRSARRSTTATRRPRFAPRSAGRPT